MGNSLSLAGKIFIYEEKSDFGMKPNKWTIRFIIIARSFAVGTAYYLVRGIPGLTSSFVAIFVALLLFDLSVAMPKFSLKFKYWIDLLEVILPRISGTIVTLSKGIIIGLVFGGLVQVGVSPFIGAVLSIGLGYHAAVQVKGNISSYVGILSALSVYEQIIKIPAFSPNLISDIGGTVLTITYATFTALFMGCICGFSLGVFTRLFLPRGYRSLTSSAYELPLYLQPFKNVLHTDDNMAVIKMNFLSKELGMQTNVTICLPSYSFADRMQGKEDTDIYVPGMKYQVLWLLHGGSGDDSDYVNFTNIVRYADDNKLAVVMPAGYNSSYTDDPEGSKYFSYVVKELPQMCQALFPFSDKREDNFVAGLSMGAGGTFKCAVTYPEKYSAALCMSGGGRGPAAAQTVQPRGGQAVLVF